MSLPRFPRTVTSVRRLGVPTGLAIVGALLVAALLSGGVDADRETSIADLAPWQRSMVAQLAEQYPGTSHPAPQVCFAPGTPDETVEKFYDDVPDSLDGYRLATRWTFTATNGGGLAQGDPTTLTWSIIPDGTSIGGFAGEPTAPAI